MDTYPIIHPGSQYNLYGKVYEVITIETTRISLRSVQSKHPLFFSPELFNALALKGEIRLHASALIDQSYEICLQCLSTKQQMAAQRKIYYVRGLNEYFQGPLPKSEVEIEAARLAKLYNNDKPPCYTSLYTWCRIYRESNFSLASLIKAPSRRARGKKLSSETDTIISDFIHKFYLQPKHPTIKTLQKLIHAYIDNENDTRSVYSTIKIDVPSTSTVKRHIKRINEYYKDIKQLGRKQAEKSNNYSTKQNPSNVLLRLVQGDSHEMDILIVDHIGRILGRPWLHVLVEVSTRYIIGYELSLTPPCAEKFLKSLRMALSSEDESRYGGRTVEITVDNGAEAANGSVQNVGHLLCINIHYAPPGTPNAKAIVERFFGTLNTQLTHAMEGSTGSNPVIGNFYSSENGACFQLSELVQIFDRFVYGVYHNEYHQTIRTSPNEAWASALCNQLPPERYTSAALNGLFRLPLHKRINNGRVQHSNLSWTGPALPDIAARLSAKQKATVYLDITDLSTVWVAHPDKPTELFEAYATAPLYQNNLTLYAHELVQKQLKLDEKKFDANLARQALLEIYDMIWEIKFNAKSKSRNPSRQDKKLLQAAERLGISKTYKQAEISNAQIETTSAAQLPLTSVNEITPTQLDEFPTYILP
ncbi:MULTISPECIES: integrase catalytic domain-containing protein [Pseudomonas]|uniref:integrase catalytic domain-containing protein n=1 Tax=Pseudomonas putida TaxID=303 RepID=UPI0023647832|nr:transposase family protein [Pseudomonas putida]MDD2098723.1 hypothetical protein [Pseudomonas putida]